MSDEYEVKRAKELRDQAVAVCERRTKERDEAHAEIRRLRRALAYYANPETYFAIAMIEDPPCGDFLDDVSETHLGDKPGKRAREALEAESCCGPHEPYWQDE